MAKVLKIAIAQNKGFEMQNVNSVEAVQGKGLINDRKFRENNNKESQITLIEIENINYYNNISNTKIAPIGFRRNIVTENIKLNDLVGKEFFVGNVKLKAHDLCRPCKYLQEKLNQKNLVKELLTKAGLRCEILTSGTITVGDIIK
tara:strand:- start:51 stop:488 length:438 start_codon:yes stop_codon:yes gene_type:complete